MEMDSCDRLSAPGLDILNLPVILYCFYGKRTALSGPVRVPVKLLTDSQWQDLLHKFNGAHLIDGVLIQLYDLSA
jgi:hypothetical protein